MHLINLVGLECFLGTQNDDPVFCFVDGFVFCHILLIILNFNSGLPFALVARTTLSKLLLFAVHLALLIAPVAKDLSS